jgi:hypothetical protein
MWRNTVRTNLDSTGLVVLDGGNLSSGGFYPVVTKDVLETVTSSLASVQSNLCERVI